MAVSRRLRFEILRRDNHACRYCGRSAPDVALAVDHVVPVALGGDDQASNLATSCTDCNNGKASVAPGSEVVADVAADALRWAAAMALAAETMVAEIDAEGALYVRFEQLWWDVVGKGFRDKRPHDWMNTLDLFLKAGLPYDVLADALYRAGGKQQQIGVANVWRYFCGICWKKIGELQERAKAILEADDE